MPPADTLLDLPLGIPPAEGQHRGRRRHNRGHLPPDPTEPSNGAEMGRQSPPRSKLEFQPHSTPIRPTAGQRTAVEDLRCHLGQGRRPSRARRCDVLHCLSRSDDDPRQAFPRPPMGACPAAAMARASRSSGDGSR
jgi:hypothetical protein